MGTPCLFLGRGRTTTTRTNEKVFIRITGKGKSKNGKNNLESSITEEMIFDAGLSKSDVKRLVKELDDAVMEVCLSAGIVG
jgi:hypothetical protein